MTAVAMEPLLTRKEVAAMLGVSVRFLEDNRREGPPYFALNASTVRYDRKKVMAWLAQREVR